MLLHAVGQVYVHELELYYHGLYDRSSSSTNFIATQVLNKTSGPLMTDVLKLIFHNITKTPQSQILAMPKTFAHCPLVVFADG